MRIRIFAFFFSFSEKNLRPDSDPAPGKKNKHPALFLRAEKKSS